MKIKKPSLKGMKNTEYLGHFAKDEYIQQGHNFSGQVPLFREPSQLEMMGPANPFDATNELSRRQAQVDAEATALRQTVADNTGEVATWQRRVDYLQAPRPTDLASALSASKQQASLSREDRQYIQNAKYGGFSSKGLGYAKERLASAQAASKEGREKAYRASRKKFTTEI
jgi:inorganic triphosphatase YgiF